MNDISELWSLPWHALQKDLAMGLAGKAVGPSVPALKAVKVQSVVAANSWLSRALQQAAPLPQVRQSY